MIFNIVFKQVFFQYIEACHNRKVFIEKNNLKKHNSQTPTKYEILKIIQFNWQQCPNYVKNFLPLFLFHICNTIDFDGLKFLSKLLKKFGYFANFIQICLNKIKISIQKIYNFLYSFQLPNPIMYLNKYTSLNNIMYKHIFESIQL